MPVADVCREALDSIRPLVDERRVRLRLEVRPPHAMMAGDADALRRLVLNLLNNARKHTEAGEITVSAECFERDGVGLARLSVRDTGSGIPPEIAARLGEAFLLNSGVVGEHYCGGTGLGLAICKGIAAAHGGELRVESAPGHGTVITAELRTDLSGPAESGGRVVLAAAGGAAGTAGDVGNSGGDQP